MLNIIGRSREELIGLDPGTVNRLLSAAEVVYMAVVLGSYWQYDYEAARQGRVGLHAELKSLRHSDGFFVSRILLAYQNILEIVAKQLLWKLKNSAGWWVRTDWVVGIPDGATELGREVARFMGTRAAEIKKEGGKIISASQFAVWESVLLVEDFCTRGTGFTEAVNAITAKQSVLRFQLYELVVINRGRLREIEVPGVGTFKILALAEHRVQDWKPEDCPLCKAGSKPIKPKATDENWRLITASQLA